MNDLDEYQNAAKRTEATFATWKDRVLCHTLGLTGEAGEAANQAKKYFYHDSMEARAKLEEELGDTLYYLTVLADALGFPLSVVAERNLAKLRKRYPDGFLTVPQRTGEPFLPPLPPIKGAPGPGLELLRSLGPDDGDHGNVLPQAPQEPGDGVTGHNPSGVCRCLRCR